MLYILKTACCEFAERVGEIKSPRGSKRDLVIAGIDRLAARTVGASVIGRLTLSELEQVCQGVSRDMVRTVLRKQQKLCALECQGRGPAALCRKKG